MYRKQAYVLIMVGLVIMMILGIGGCASVRPPEHVRPDVVAKQDWSRSLSEERRIDADWWHGFDDPQLNDLVERAVASNLDLKVLAARTEQARAQIDQAQALRLPVVNAGTRTDSMDISSLGTSNKYSTGADLVWELDVWGKMRQGVQAQDAGFQASRADWRAGYLVMVASVIDGYFRLRQIDRQLAQQRKALEQNESILSLYGRLHDRGLAPGTQVTRQEAELHTLRIGLNDLERARALTVNALAALVGAVPGEFSLPDTGVLEALPVPEVPAGLPSDLLARRPDILAAEYRLMQQVRLEGQARLSQLPTIGLTGLGGSASYGLKGLLDTLSGGISSVVQFPVFDPNVRARIRVSEAQVDVAEQQYRATVMKAFEEVESVLINLESRREQRTELLGRREKLEDMQRLVQRRLELGLVSQLEVLEQERSLLAAELALIENEWQIASDTVALFKAVGGGWPAEDPTATASAVEP